MVYFNNAATSFPKPEAVIRAVDNALRLEPYNSYRENVTRKSETDICRKKISELLNFPDYKRVVLCSGSTEAINIAVNGIIKRDVHNDKHRINHVITTQSEHNSMLRPLYHLRDLGIIQMDVIACNRNGKIHMDDIQNKLAINTCLVAVNHASNVTGVIQDIDSIYNLCARREIPTLFDISQSAGCVDIDISEKPLAMYAFTGHKSLLGPSGTGGLLVGNNIDLNVWQTGGTGIKSDLETMPDILPVRYEPGTNNHHGIAGLAASVTHITEKGVQYFGNKKNKIANYLINELCHINGISTYSDTGESNPCGVVSFIVKGTHPGDVGYILFESFNIRVRTGLHCAPLIHKAMGTFPNGTVRASFSSFNTLGEVDQLIQALKFITEVN